MKTTFPEKVLFVDDDPNILEAMRRQFRRHFLLSFAGGGEEALEVIKDEGPIAVVVSDRSMPGMNGVELLSEIRDIEPDTIRIMLTGDTHLQAAMGAVNEGQIFRFLTKPCSRDVMRKTLEASIEQYRLVTSNKVLLSQTLQGSVKILMEMFSLVDAQKFGDALRLKPMVKSLTAEMNASPAWEIEIAAMLKSIGLVTVPPKILRKVQEMERVDPDEQEIYEQHAQVGHDLISNIPRLENVAKIVLYQHKNYDGSGFPLGICSGDEIPLGSRIIKVATDYDRWLARSCNPRGAIARLQNSTNYDPYIVHAIEKIGNKTNVLVRKIRLSELVPGMVVAADLRTVDGSILLVQKDQEVSPMQLKRIHNFQCQTPITDVVEVYTLQHGSEKVRKLVTSK